ncbi:AraC family transcriptional regulator [Mangrovactinospora gilvigrisea]|uniref:AraC family transcriptional regulator n=1 Tax=Mangrovactinospora gilvigrisea TaxID=1428644 RepID=A0A1J7BKG7_9ACTN|nr:helix-turn-helix domain-containing protein [Mangrovactinospora gilvigrisea]OIV39093.1 AraC family transcriptional regulator [Mangrovactinospora gilvigrisea]
MLRTVAVVLPDDVAPFEFGVVCEAFGVDRTAQGVPPIEFRVCGARAGAAVSTTVGCRIVPEFGLEGLDGADLVAVPAHGYDPPVGHPVVAAVREAHRAGATVLSVCSGAFLLGEAGLLDGRRCTTHWMHADRLAERYPLAKVDPDVLFVDEGTVITSAGTAAGIDACLHLIRRELGSAVATAVARRMVVPPQRDGGQRQFVDLPIPADAHGGGLQQLLAWLTEHLAEPHTVAALARRARMSERTFARRFTAETGTTPHRWLTQQRVLLARRLLEDTGLELDAVAASAGLGDAALLRHHFRRATGLTPQAYRRAFASRG